MVTIHSVDKDNTEINNIKIYCPHCVKILVYQNDKLYCENGECYFRKWFESIFIEKILSLSIK